MRQKIFIFSIFIIFLGKHAYGQNLMDVEMQFFEDSAHTKRLFPELQLKVDSAQLNSQINQQLYNLYELGYLATQYQINYVAEGKASILFVTNQLIKVGRLSQGNVNDEILTKTGFDTRNFNNKPFSHRRIVSLLNSILDYAENHGYPFASIKLDSIEFKDHYFNAWINFRSGPLIVFDSLIISGYDKLKSKYLMTHLGIYKGKPYEEKLIEEIPNKMKLLTYVRLTDAPDIQISGGKCSILLGLNHNKVSNFDGILGVLPNQNEGNKLLITGQLNLDLHNLFSSGKRIGLEWQSFDANSQLLEALYYHPNLFRTPINIQGDFYLLKQDTTFINRKFALELSLLSKNSSQIGFKTELVSSRLISTSAYEGVTELPDNIDYNLNYYGINYQLSRYNNLILPTEGWGFHLTGLVGQKKIIKNPVFNDEIFNNIDENTVQFRIAGDLDKYWPVYKSIYLKTKISSGYLKGDNLFQSDLFRLGGLRTLRGFVENQFFTSSFGLANLELRAIFSQETYFMLFFDQAVLSTDFIQSDSIQYPFGTGAGFSFTTNAGVFNFVFAMGKSIIQPFGFEYSKIHFGYISRF